MRKYRMKVREQIMNEYIRLIVLWTFCFWWWLSPQNIYDTESMKLKVKFHNFNFNAVSSL